MNKLLARARVNEGQVRGADPHVPYSAAPRKLQRHTVDGEPLVGALQ